jgi:hypothetical protein
LNKPVLALGLFLISFAALAEYRVYQYLVKPRTTWVTINQMEAKSIRSTLNPQAFIAYHGGQGAVDITLMRTWMCTGVTGKKDFCPHPSERIAYEQ